MCQTSRVTNRINYQTTNVLLLSISFPKEIILLITDYAIGPSYYWEHQFNACLIEVYQMIRPDDSHTTYLERTGISDCDLSDDVLILTMERIQTGQERYLASEVPSFYEHPHPLESFVHKELEIYFSEYDYDTRVGTPISQRVSELLGYEYEFIVSKKKKKDTKKDV